MTPPDRELSADNNKHRANKHSADNAFTADRLSRQRADLEQARRLYVGYSGGLDSHVLLHALVALLGPAALTALHINHQLSPQAATWAGHCRQTCAELGVAYIEETVQVGSRADGLEAAARAARYAAFDRYVGAGDLLLLAHHADDQAETILFRLLRGAGPRGLAGIPRARALRHGRLLRPLLDVTRAALYEYARRAGLRWVEDDSNQCLDMDRNHLRHRVLPAVAARWPAYSARLARSAALCGTADSLASDLADLDLRALDERAERLGWSLDAVRLAALGAPRRANVLRHWALQKGLPAPGSSALAALAAELLPARADAQPLVFWAGGQWRRFRERLYQLPDARWRQVALGPLCWADFPAARKLADGSVLQATPAHADSGAALRLPLGVTPTIGFRQGGERCRPAGRAASTTLKKLLQEYALPPWLRDRVPLILVDGQLAAVGDLWVCASFAAPAGEAGWHLDWHYPEGPQRASSSDRGEGGRG